MFKMEKLIPVALLLVTVLYSGIVSVNAKPAVPNENNLNRQQSIFKLSAVNMHFALRLYRQIASQPSSASKNIFFSPISISAALAMLSLGAKHNTLDQLQQVLWLSNMTKNDAAEMHVAFKYLLQDLTSESNELHLKMGNSLYIQQGLNLKNKFLEDTRQFYEAEASNVDFTAPEEAKEQINTYVRNHTDGKIQDFIKELNRDTVMILLNYVLFKGKWVKTFDPLDTSEADFFVDDTTTVRVQMMKKMGMFYHSYDRQLSSSVILVPYKGNASLILILPDAGKLAEVEQNLNITNFQNLIFSSQFSSASLHLPKFSLKASYKLKDLLTTMGIIDAFTNNADLTGISESEPLKVSEVTHEAVLDVDEKGTEAAAVTGIEIMPMSLPPKYVFNKPFLLLIAQHNTKSVLFAGRVMNPTV
uniref:alpha-1-antitrypsin-like isoform X1 n=2 Tax=Pristiophorus japonicus TaxID=55135 RepID=UPI00398E5BDB